MENELLRRRLVMNRQRLNELVEKADLQKYFQDARAKSSNCRELVDKLRVMGFPKISEEKAVEVLNLLDNG